MLAFVAISLHSLIYPAGFFFKFDDEMRLNR